MSTTGTHACGTRTDGNAWCCGYNGLGQLGDGTTTNRSGPVRVGSTPNWVTIDVGGLHTVGLRDA